ncbi:hypothetical protein ACFXMT_36245 [Streptomyces mirabilis]|uniref:hypothetical protein n=1 Tax=Streptomyces mirabilis TaxID=68239 RepID=UPI0036D022C6
MAAFWDTNLASSQMVPVFGTSKSATDRVRPASPPPARTIGTRSNPQAVITPLAGW